MVGIVSSPTDLILMTAQSALDCRPPGACQEQRGPVFSETSTPKFCCHPSNTCPGALTDAHYSPDHIQKQTIICCDEGHWEQRLFGSL